MSEHHPMECCRHHHNNVPVNGQNPQMPPKILRTQPAADICETSDNFIIKMDMPGLNPDAISVKLDKEILTIEAKSEIEGLPPLEFHRQFRVMRGLDASACDADYKQGVLALTLPKPSTAKPQQIRIQSEE